MPTYSSDVPGKPPTRWVNPKKSNKTPLNIIKPTLKHHFPMVIANQFYIFIAPPRDLAPHRPPLAAFVRCAPPCGGWCTARAATRHEAGPRAGGKPSSPTVDVEDVPRERNPKGTMRYDDFMMIWFMVIFHGDMVISWDLGRYGDLINGEWWFMSFSWDLIMWFIRIYMMVYPLVMTNIMVISWWFSEV